MSEQATEQTTEPEWLVVQRRMGGYLDPVGEDTAKDIDYLMARLRKILDTAEKVGSLRWMPDDLEELIKELRPHGRAGDAVFAELKATYPELFWGRYGGAIIGCRQLFGDRDVPERCATALGLTEVEETSGERDWRGTYAGLPVRVIGYDKAVQS
ncbi:hypothetical protein [Nocardia sp. NPDC019302]|uniref:hypothetical protein n=1 Tax=Nocardia sp. NPDC019302 TaxID=3154592 RepID=UPI0033E08DA4